MKKLTEPAGSPSIPMPDAFMKQMKSLLGEADFFKYQETLEAPALKGLRINLLKAGVDEEILALLNMECRQVPWEAHGYYYEEGRPGQSPLHEAGLYYIQEPSAMSAAALLDPQPGERILDLCAAPGGKSTQLGARMKGEGILVCNEPVPGRAKILSSNIERMGIRNAVVLSEMPERLEAPFEAYFDRILVDAPCSGEGMFRKAPESRLEWHEGSPAQCHARQMEILKSAEILLKPGGTLVYSTCTFNNVENEETVSEFLLRHPEFELEPFSLPGLGECEGMKHVYPFEVEGEGHFLAKLRKRGDSAAGKQQTRKEKGAGTSRNRKVRQTSVPELPDIFLHPPETARLFQDARGLWLLPDGFDPERLQGLRWLRCGLALCDLKGKPDHACGMALAPSEVKNSVPLTFEEMTAYQAGETLRKDCRKGWILLHFKGASLGWGKQSDGIIKNHYPKGLWRR